MIQLSPSSDGATELSRVEARLDLMRQDRLVLVDVQQNLTEDVVAGIKFADCLPDWLADAVVLARVSDAKAVASVLAHRVDEAIVG